MDNNSESKTTNPRPYRQTQTIANKAVFGLQAHVMLAVLTFFTEVWYLAAVDERFLTDEMHPVEWVEGSLALAYFAVLFWTVVCYSRWKHRSYRNLPALGCTDMRTNAGWAVGTYFVPILNLFRPYQAMKDIYNGSRSEPVKTNVPLINGWWAAWIVMGVANRLAMRLAGRAESVVELQSATVAALVAEAVTAVGAVLLIKLITRITAQQTAKAAEIAKAGPQPA